MNLIRALGAASLELVVLAALAGLLLRLSIFRSARAAALLWLIVLAKPILTLFGGAPLSVPIPSRALLQSETWRTYHQIEVERREPEVGLSRSNEVEELAVVAPPEPDPASQRWRGVLARLFEQVLPAIWFLGVGGFFLAAALDRYRLHCVIRRSEEPDALLLELYRRSVRWVGLRRRPRLLVTDSLETPAIAGWLGSVILLPKWMARERETAELEWSLRHELMHAKLWDPQAAAVRQLSRSLFFFHPVVWLAGWRWELAAEMACDRALVRNRQQARSYAEQLYRILVKARGRQRLGLATGLYATRSQLRERMKALLQAPVDSSGQLSAPAVLGLAAILLTLLGVGIELPGPTAFGPKVWAEIEETQDGQRLYLHASGWIEFEVGDDLPRMADGSIVVVEEERDGWRKRLELQGTEKGAPRVSYLADGLERPFDAAAREWSAAMLGALRDQLR